MGVCSGLDGLPLTEAPRCLTRQATSGQKPPSSLLPNSPNPLKSPRSSLVSTLETQP